MSKGNGKSKRRRGTVDHARINKTFQTKVEKVGVEQVGLLAVDPHKRQFEAVLTNGIGKQLMEQEKVTKTSVGIQEYMKKVDAACLRYGIKEVLAGIERTSRFHMPIRRAFKKRNWTVQTIQPYATKKLRQAIDSGSKTDETDLDAILRAMMVGYGIAERELPERWEEWRALNRVREDNVKRLADLKNQIQDRLEALLPGYTGMVQNIWRAPVYLCLAEKYGTPEAIRAASLEELRQTAKSQSHVVKSSTLNKVKVWSSMSCQAEPGAKIKHHILCRELEQLRSLENQIHEYEKQLVYYLAETPFVLLLALKGINVVSAGGYGAELGPIEHYVNAKNITGRAGIRPSVYQSGDETNSPNGPMLSRRNARLRDAIFEIAGNLMKCNPYFQGWAALRKGTPTRKLEARIACRFTRISYQIIRQQTLMLEHPCIESRDAILRKLYDFALSHGFDLQERESILKRAMKQLPSKLCKDEADSLNKLLPKRRTKPNTTQLGEVLETVMAKLLEKKGDATKK